MSVNIGNNNKIKNSNIAENIKNNYNSPSKTLYEKHPIIFGILISLIAGFILLFSFWDKIIIFLEDLF